MGIATSFMGIGGGLPSTQMLSFVTATLYTKFIEKDITTFEEFHVAILDIFTTMNSALPGKHYDMPTRRKVEECFCRWKTANDNSQKKQIFINFMRSSITRSRLDDYTMITGIVTPPAAMAAKKAGEKYVPQLRMIKVIPDVVFVPSATLIALVSAKLSRKLFLKSIASS